MARAAPPRPIETLTEEPAMTIQLFSARACPFAHRTRLVLAEKGVPFDLQEIDLQNKPAHFLAVSAYGKVPAIEHDGVHLYESAVINEYLDERFPEPSLLPAGPPARAQARIWIDYANTRFVQAYGALLRAENAEVERAARGALDESLAFLEKEGLRKLSPEGPFFFGRAPSLVDLTFYPWFERLPALQHFRDYQLPAELTRLARWREALGARESVKGQSASTEYYIERYSRFVKRPD
jgi:glutathione S-transferase